MYIIIIIILCVNSNNKGAPTEHSVDTLLVPLHCDPINLMTHALAGADLI